MLKMFNIWISVVLTAAAVLAGCSEDAMRDESSNGEERATDLYIRFRMNLCGDGIPDDMRAVSRADAVADETPGTSRENAVDRVDLLVCDADSGELIDIVSLSENQIAKITDPQDFVVVPLRVNNAKSIYIYAVANMTDKMRLELILGRSIDDIALYSSNNDYWTVIDEFAPGSAGSQTTLESSGDGTIIMTGLFAPEAGGSTRIAIAEENYAEDNPLAVKADISRIVAKVHVLVETPDLSHITNVRYVYAEDKTAKTAEQADEDYANWIGWIRLENVRYMPNATNKSTYVFPHANDAADSPLSKWRDLNMSLDSYIVGGQFNAPMWTKDYVFYDGLSLHKENISANAHLAQAEKYDYERLSKTKNYNPADSEADRYTQGMYCLENYFDAPLDAATFETFNDVIPMVTNVSIAAKLTPRSIVVIKNYAEQMDMLVDAFVDKNETYFEQLGLTLDDFTQHDKDRWTEIKERYEGFSDAAADYREDFRIIKTVSEADASDIINWSLKINKLWSRDAADFENGLYPDDTFYVYDTEYDIDRPADDPWTQRYLYLTAGAVTAATDSNMRIKTYSVPHLGGWGYYYTYIDQLGLTENGKTPYAASQVTRNTYYLITVGNFGKPGGTITRPEYIRVNTVPVGWDYSGRGDIILH